MAINTLNKELLEETKGHQNEEIRILKAFSELNNLGDFIALSRRANNRTQKEVAETLGIPASRLNRLEKGNYKNPPVDLLHDVAKVLDVDLDLLIELARFAAHGPSDEFMNNITVKVVNPISDEEWKALDEELSQDAAEQDQDRVLESLMERIQNIEQGIKAVKADISKLHRARAKSKIVAEKKAAYKTREKK